VDLALEAEQDPRLLRESLDDIKLAAERGAILTRRLLTFARQHVSARSVVDLAPLLEGLFPMLRRLLPATLELTLDVSSGGHVLGDPTQLEQVVVNLVANARDAITGSGRVEIATRLGQIDEAATRSRSWLRAGPCVSIVVTDSGCGIPEEHLDRIFDPFFTTKDVGKGTGLGLSIVYGIVQQHEGMLSVQSGPAGTRFEVSFPLAEPQAAEPASPPKSAPRGVGHEVVLLAEDEPAVRTLALRILERAGYRVVAASDGLEAVAAFDQSPSSFDLVLLDVVMPGLTGAEVFKRLRARRPDLRVLFSSGYSAGALEPQLVSQPRCSRVEKPYDQQVLLDAVRAALDVE
jgi:CheY-like chemotaxis protein